MLHFCKTVTEKIISWVESTVETIVAVTKEVCSWVTKTVKKIVEVIEEVCDWLPWPLDALCGLVTKLVEVFVDISEWVCNTVTDLVKTVSKVLIKIVKIVSTIVCTIVDFIITVIVSLVDFILQLADWILNWIVTLPEMLACFLGFRPKKFLKLCVVVLADERGAPVQSLASVDAQVQQAASILAQCNVEVVACDPVVVSVDDELLTVGCGFSDWLFTRPAMERAGHGSKNYACCTRWISASIIPRPALIAIFVRDVENARGCYLWPANYVTVDGSGAGRSLAHEIGHANDLTHADAATDPANLMVTGGSGSDLTGSQCCVLRRGRFVSLLGL